MIKFPSINQFRNVVQHVRQQAQFKGLDAEGNAIMDRTAKAPTLTFQGTVKLHGTNAAIVYADTGIKFQSRERELDLMQDNAGFMAQMLSQVDTVCEIEDLIMAAAGLTPMDHPTIVVYGEWCGGNIQKGVAITGLPKMFVIFAIKINSEWFNGFVPGLVNKAAGIYDIRDFNRWYVQIDFEKPEEAQNQLAQWTQAVEECCPVGKEFGVIGIGEGIVWRCIERPSSDYWFKVKGEKHSVSKVKTLASVDIEAVETLRSFIVQTVTEARLEQGLQNLLNEQLKPFDMSSMGDFIRWVHADVVKEELDLLVASGLDVKKIGGPLAKVARDWFTKRLNEEVFSG